MITSLKKVMGGLALAASLFFASNAMAVGELDFNIDANHAGAASISYTGGVNPLVGSLISVDNVTGINGTPLNNGTTAACSACVLSFTSGANTGGYTWGAGGSISIVGGVDLIPGGALEIPAGTTLISGSITSATVVGLGGTFQVAIAAFVNTTNAQLATFYGMTGGPGASWNGNFNISFNATAVSPNAFASTSVLSGDVITREGKVPEPTSMLLFGFGLVGLGVWARKRLGK